MNKKILVLEDNQDVQRILQGTLGEVDLQFSSSLQEFHFKLKTMEKPDLFLLDIVVSDGTGIEAFTTLKSNENWKNIPVIFLSGKDAYKQKFRNLTLGGADFVSKPFNPTDLKNKIMAYLNKDSMVEEMNVFMKGDLCFDLRKKILSCGGELAKSTIPLPRFEFEILLFLTKNEDLVFSKLELNTVVRNLENHTSSKILSNLIGVDEALEAHMGHIMEVLERTSFQLKQVSRGYQLIRRESPFRAGKVA